VIVVHIPKRNADEPDSSCARNEIYHGLAGLAIAA